MKLLALVTQYGVKQELGGAGGLVHGAVGKLLVFDHVQQVVLHLLHCVQRRIAPIVFGHAVDGSGIGLLGAQRKAALNHRILHALT